jgi:hypothetical protein
MGIPNDCSPQPAARPIQTRVDHTGSLFFSEGVFIAFEINDMSHTPHEKFIQMAKEQGLKFTSGSDSRDNNAGRLTFCRRMAQRCNLKAEDFYIPVHKTGNL